MTAFADRGADQLRERVLTLVRTTARTRKASDSDIARATRVSKATISRIFDGTQGLSLDNAVRLARWAGYELALVPRDRAGS